MKVWKNVLFWVVAIVALAILSNISGFGAGERAFGGNQIAFSEFMNLVESKDVESVVIAGPDISGKLVNGGRFSTYAPNDPSIFETMRQAGVKVEARPMDNTADTFWGVFVSWFPMILLIGVWVFFMRQANAGNRPVGVIGDI